eukprot:c10581_g1_i1 orf=389-676(+)
MLQVGVCACEERDFDADGWSRVADVPMCITIDLFFVYKGELYVGGCICDHRDDISKLFSYRLSLNEWKGRRVDVGQRTNKCEAANKKPNHIFARQ